MSLTVEQRQHWDEVLGRTGGHRETMKRERDIPEWYTDCLNKVEQTEQMLTVPEAEVPVRIIVSIAKDKEPNCPVHVNYHGGGFIFKQDHDDDLYCAHIASEIKGVVVDVDYATSDEHPFPMGFDQSYGVAKWAVSMCDTWGADPKKVSVGGASAGGNLAIAVAMKAVQTGEFSLNLQVLDYAANDNYMPLGNPAQIRSEAFSQMYVDGNVEMLKDPFVSPVFATDDMLKGLPRTLIVSAENCPFTPCNTELGKRMVKAGVEVTHAYFAGSNHGFTVRIAGAWKEAQDVIIHAIKAACI